MPRNITVSISISVQPARLYQIVMIPVSIRVTVEGKLITAVVQQPHFPYYPEHKRVKRGSLGNKITVPMYIMYLQVRLYALYTASR